MTSVRRTTEAERFNKRMLLFFILMVFGFGVLFLSSRAFAQTPTVNFSAETMRVTEESGRIAFAFILSDTTDSVVTVPYTVGGIAESGVDHDLADGNVTIAIGERTGIVEFNVIDDDLAEDDETILVSMGTPVNADKGETDLLTITLLDNDAVEKPSVGWSISGQTVSEGAGTVTLTAVLSAKTTNDVTIPYTVSGTAATDGSDHSLEDGELIIPAGDTFVNLFFDVVDDEETEGNEVVIISMETPVNADTGDITVHTVNIMDDDETTIPTVSWNTSYQNVLENQGSAFITAVMSTASENDVVVAYTVAGTAEGDGVDHELADGELTLAAGETLGMIEVVLTDDEIYEPDETVIVSMGSVENAVAGPVTQHVITIKDNDGLPEVNWSAGEKDFAEGVGDVEIKAVLNAAGVQDVIVPYTVGGTAATDGSDHTLEAGDITIPAGESSAVLSFSIVDDAIPEENETIVISMGTPENATKGTSTTMVITIIENDRDNVPPQITIVGDNPVTVLLNGEYEDPGAIATDNRDGELTARIRTVNNVNPKVEGTYQVQYNVTDSSGNEATTGVRIVHVVRIEEIYTVSTVTPEGVVLDQDLLPLGDVQVTSDASSHVAYSGEDGAFAYEPLYNTGRVYFLTFTKPGYVSTTRRFSGTENLENVVLVSVADPGSYDIITGNCKSYTGAFLDNVFVYLENSDYPSGTFSDADGKYRIAVNREALPYTFSASKYAHVTETITPFVAESPMDFTITPETRLQIGLPSTTEEYQAAIEEGIVTMTVTADPVFTGKPYEIDLDNSDLPVFDKEAYTIVHTPYESFNVVVSADSSEDGDIRTDYVNTREVSFHALWFRGEAVSTSAELNVINGFPVLLNSSDEDSNVRVAIPVDGFQGEKIPDKVKIQIREYKNLDTNVVSGTVVEIQVTDPLGKILGGNPDNPEYPLKKLYITMDYPSPITSDGLTEGTDQIRYATSVTGLLEEDSSIVSAESIALVDTTTVTFRALLPGAYGLDLINRPDPPQELLESEEEDNGAPCFISICGKTGEEQ